MSSNTFGEGRDSPTLTMRQKKPQAGVEVAVAVGVRVGKGVLVLVAVAVAVAGSTPSGASELRLAIAPAGDSSKGAPAEAAGTEAPTTDHTPSKTVRTAAAKMNLIEEEDDNARTFL